MSATTKAKKKSVSELATEAADIIESLPPKYAEALLEYANYLADKADEEEWDRRLNEAHARPKFEAFIEQARADIAAGKSTPLDPGTM